MGRTWSYALVLAVGCGRIGFDPTGGRGGDSGLPGGESAFVSSCPSFATFCDDFETGDTAKWNGTDFNGPPGSAVVDSARVHAGTFALDATVASGTTEGAFALVHRFSATTTGMLAVRAWINTPQPMVHFDLVMEFRNASASRYLTAGGNDNAIWVSSDNRPGSLTDHTGTVPTPAVDTWTCAELDVTLAPSPAVTVYANDAVVVVTDPLGDPTPSYSEVHVGVTRSDMAGYHVFVDDVAVATQHIGCP